MNNTNIGKWISGALMLAALVAPSARAEISRLCPSRLYPWERSVAELIPGSAVARPDILGLAWAGHANGITAPGRAVALEDGGSAVEWCFKVDHHDKSDYPVGWPNFEAFPKPALDLGTSPVLSFRARLVTDLGRAAPFRLILSGGKDGRERTSAHFLNTVYGQWRECHISLNGADWARQLTRLHFYAEECDFRHGEEVAFQFRDFSVGKLSQRLVGLSAGQAGASLWVGARGDGDSRAVILESAETSLPALLHVDNRLGAAIASNATVAVRLRDVITGRDTWRRRALGVNVPSGSRAAVRLAIDLKGLEPSYYHALADILVDGKSVLAIRKGSDDFLIRRPGESMTSTLLLLRMGMAGWTADRLFGGFMHATDISLPHSYDPYDTSREAYREFLAHFALLTMKVCEGYEAAMPGLALAAEAYRRANDAPRLRFAENLLWNGAEAMLAMQDACGGVVYSVNDLALAGIGQGGGASGRDSQYSTDQTAEWMRGLAYASLYYARKGGEELKVRRLNAAMRKAGEFLTRHSRWGVAGKEDVLQNFSVSFSGGTNTSRKLWHQEGRQCDVYQPRVVAGLSYAAIALLRNGESVPDDWWRLFDASQKWMTGKMAANGWFDTQCGDVVEGGCHTFLGNIYLGEGLFGVAMADRLAGRAREAEAAIAASRRAYRYVTDDCWIRGHRYQYPLEFWVGPYVYWLFTEWREHVGSEPAFEDWLKTLDRRWYGERKCGDFLRMPKMDCGRASANGTLVIAILGSLALKDMEERGTRWSLFGPSPVQTATDEPFVMLRLGRKSTVAADALRARMREIASHPGSADAIWFCGADYEPRATAHPYFEMLARYAPDCRKTGVRLDYQQGQTLGHSHLVAPYAFPSNAWQVSANGAPLRMLCPRSPAVLDYEERWMADLCRTVRPGAVWLDDDLRMGYSKENGCFCDRCVAAFNARFGHALTREELAKRLFGPAKREALRRDWVTFVGESVASFGRAARRGANRGNPTTMVAYQSVNAASLLAAGRNLTPLLTALSDGGLRPTGVRVGSECYYEDARDLSWKMLSVARESERCRAAGLNLAQVCYEQENYTREVLHKSAEGALVESALALANGCDSLSQYRWDAGRDEPLGDFAEFAARSAEWRGYLKRLGDCSRTTTLGGAARFVGADADLGPSFSLEDPLDTVLADLGLGVTVAESPTRLYYVTAKSLDEWGEGDARRITAPGVGAVVDAAVWDRFVKLVGSTNALAHVQKFEFFKIRTDGSRAPTTAERLALIDAFDRAGRLPVRIDRAHRMRVMPRLDRARGDVVAVTIWNESAGAMPSSEVRVRRPAGAYPVWATAGAADLPLHVKSRGADETVIVVPEIPARQIGTVYFLDSCPESACETVSIEGERAYLPPYDAKKCPWQVGYRLRAARMWEVSASDAVIPASVKAVAADGRLLRENVDYRLEHRFGAIGLIGAALTNANPVTLAYACRAVRLDAWYVNAEGRVDVKRGAASATRPERPCLPKGAKLLGHFYVRGVGRADNGRFFAARGAYEPPKPPVPAAEAMPKTLAKLRAGGTVRILAWGDSVTECSYLFRSERWQERVAAALGAMFPAAKIELVTEAWGGRNTPAYLNEPPGSPHNYAEKVLAARPDLVISEFVNDGGLDANAVERLYSRVLADFRKAGIEWVAFTPHYIIPDWMGSPKGIPAGGDDPRAYTRALRAFAAKNRIGLAEASARWGHLADEGVPYTLFFVNGVNHPDAESMGFYVDAFLDLLK